MNGGITVLVLFAQGLWLLGFGIGLVRDSMKERVPVKKRVYLVGACIEAVIASFMFFVGWTVWQGG